MTHLGNLSGWVCDAGQHGGQHGRSERQHLLPCQAHKACQPPKRQRTRPRICACQGLDCTSGLLSAEAYGMP